VARTLRVMGRPIAAILALAALFLGPAVVVAHPLGNFTINHYAGLVVGRDRIDLDVVIDEAEIPAFQTRQGMDADTDGEVSDGELAAGAEAGCREVAGGLQLTVDGSPVAIASISASLDFPRGSTGLSTARFECGFSASLAAIGAVADAGPTRITFEDANRPERLGWREIVVSGDGVSVTGVDGELRSASVSQRLTAYPAALLGDPLSDTSITIDATPTVVAMPSPSAAAVPADAAAAVPGGIAGEVPSIFQAADVTPLVLLLSILTAAALGAGHALTPGHGKTLMAAYLVGTRGTPLHAVGLGLSVSLSHTAGIIVLAAVVVGAADVLPPDAVVRGAPFVAAVSILVIGGWMLAGEWHRRRGVAAGAAHDHGHAQADDHAHAHGGAHDHGHGHTHAHGPSSGGTVTWRSLFVLGLAGGLIPSTSALLILLGSIAAGRPAFGFVLVVAFGLGMAAVMGGIGLALVVARERLDRVPAGDRLARIRGAVPLVAAVLVFGFGVVLTVQALTVAPAL
jgi:nickel/cobalt transporter (NicO) family protein